MEDKKSNENAEYLAHKWLNKTISPHEKSAFDEWYQQKQTNELEVPDYIASSETAHQEKIFKHIKNQTFIAKKQPLWPKIAYAASVILVLGIAVSMYYFQHISGKTSVQKSVSNIKPGTNKATLTLANGKKIELDNTSNGNISEQPGMVITKNKGGQLVYDYTATPNMDVNPKMAYNHIETPKGGQYQIILQDGTKVWLNTATKLKYPVKFIGAERVVELQGEAYFEVAKNAKKPFIVNTPGQRLVVTGTHFNLNSYPDENATVTTLLEGSVKLLAKADKKATAVLLKPGQQSQFKNEAFKVKEVDVAKYTAWKDGFFQFDYTDFKVAMREIARWYNVEISYGQHEIPQKSFSGKIQRNLTSPELIEALNFSGINCEIRNGKIIINP